MIIEYKRNSVRPWMADVIHSYSKAALEVYKHIPGCNNWDAETKIRSVPYDMVEPIAKHLGAHALYKGPQTTNCTFLFNADGLRPYQSRAIQRALQTIGYWRKGGWLFNERMRCGKTAECIRTLDALDPTSIVIVAPALALRVWERELAKWSTRLKEDITVVGVGFGRKQTTKAQKHSFERALTSRVVITTYALLEQLLDKRNDFEVAVYDEAHRLQSRLAKQTKAAFKCKAPMRLMLTGTPVPNRPQQVWNLLDMLQPGAFGKPDSNNRGCFAFNQRYLNGNMGEYGWSYEGVRSDTREELVYRINNLSSRATNEELVKYLPRHNVSKLSVEGDKITAVKEWAADARVEDDFICIITHGIDRAKEIATELDAYLITGEMLPAKRLDLIEKIAQESKGILVATAGSVEEAIDISFCKSILFAEIPPRLKTFTQCAARFTSTLNNLPPAITLLCQEYSNDERQADQMIDKLRAVDQLALLPDSEVALMDALNTYETDPEKFREKWSKAMLSDGELDLKALLDEVM